MDARALDFPDEAFDTVVAMHVISVVPEPERVVAEMARVCRPGGEVLVLSHFLHEQGPLAFLGRRFGPLANRLGWHSDFTMEPVLSCDRLDLVEQRPSPPFGRHPLSHHDLRLVVGQLAQAGRRVLGVEVIPEPVGEPERRLHQRVPGARPHRPGVGLAADQERQGLRHDRLPRPGLAGDGGEPRRRFELGTIDHHETADLEPADHGLPNFSR
jgi:SAM-dependent methyltransferase